MVCRKKAGAIRGAAVNESGPTREAGLGSHAAYNVGWALAYAD
jgi:hypothetical protein